MLTSDEIITSFPNGLDVAGTTEPFAGDPAIMVIEDNVFVGRVYNDRFNVDAVKMDGDLYDVKHSDAWWRGWLAGFRKGTLKVDNTKTVLNIDLGLWEVFKAA